MFDDLRISDFSYDLPDEKIAKYPLERRDNSKLLVYRNGKIEQNNFFNLDTFIPRNTLLVANNTRVIYARLHFQKSSGANIEIFCLNPHLPKEYNLAFDAKYKCYWQCIVGNAKKWKSGNLSLNYTIEGKQEILNATKISDFEDKKIIEFTWDSDLTFSEILNAIGEVPIPPYLNRKSEDNDKKTYQTVYSKINGSVAAPTAGLHFTKESFEKLKHKNIHLAEVTLHVGAGTFKPVKNDKVVEHSMHTEYFFVDNKTLQKISDNIGNITAVGTTSLRTLESIFWLGVKIFQKSENFNFLGQYEAYNLPKIDAKAAINAIIEYLKENGKEFFEAQTQIIIMPGYEFQIVNMLITNFHQPKSTLLLLVAAFIGDDWHKVYDYALSNDFRFLSYGDSSLLFKK